ncbi:GxxExxY protein [bacterium]|nr:GxxExxY protein [bacterium]
MMGTEVTEGIIGAAIEVHRTLGPGLLESIYEECLAEELGLRRFSVERQYAVPLVYKGRCLGADLRVDLLIDDLVVVELKAIGKILPIHAAQVVTYLRLTQKPFGLLINFNVPLLKDGIRRYLNPLLLRSSVPSV